MNESLLASLSPGQQAAVLLLERRKVQSNLTAWAKLCGFEPALHHRYLIEKLERASRGEIKRLAIFLPPGSAKSTYSSVLFPPWFLGQRPGSTILACSHNYDLAAEFGRRSRNFVSQFPSQLGFSLSPDSKASDRWNTTNGGQFYCAGVGAGIAGRRADLGLIDDPIGKKEDADSLQTRDKQWNWYQYDFKPRLKPDATVVLIQTRWHEDDLAGRIIEREGEDWTIIRIPLIADEANDPLGRSIGQPLWPEWFNEKLIEDAKKSDAFIPLYQNRPSPEEGDQFKKEWLVEYWPGDLPKLLRAYGSSDHAVGQKQTNDPSCIGCVYLDENDNIWVPPDLTWKRIDSGEQVEEMISFAERYKPLDWWAETDHISKAIGPFLNKRMMERSVYFVVTELSSGQDKVKKAQSIRGRMKMRKVLFPAFAPWWQKAKAELLSFPVGTHDDFVDFLSNIGRGLDRLARPSVPKNEPMFDPSAPWHPTYGWLKESAARRARELEPSYGDR